MVFTTPTYFVFLLVVVLGYFSLPGRFRWLWLLLAGYAFYASWSPTFLSLLGYATGVAYLVGRQLPSVPVRWRQQVLWVGISGLLLPLLFYKYYNFVGRSAMDALAWGGIAYQVPLHQYLLPVGISFFTFQTISYIIDVYRGFQRPEKHVGYFALYVAFFPVLLAGPIERAKRLLPQLRKTTAFSYDDGVRGLLLILWGCFKKVVLAARFQEYADLVFNAPARHYGLSVLLACICFAFQLYCDFSGYSDIAIGSARLLGIRLGPNFVNRVYAARSRTEFWQGWHMSLTSWFRDYVFAPLSKGKGRNTRAVLYVNLVIIYLLTGLWHEAAWSFLLWGGLNGVWVVAEQASRSRRRAFFERIGFGPDLPLHQWLATVFTFITGALLSLWFRANSLADGVLLVRHMLVTDWTILIPGISASKLLLMISGLIVMDLAYYWAGGRPIEEVLANLPNRLARWGVALGLAEAILLLGKTSQATFYYFHF